MDVVRKKYDNTVDTLSISFANSLKEKDSRCNLPSIGIDDENLYRSCSENPARFNAGLFLFVMITFYFSYGSVLYADLHMWKKLCVACFIVVVTYVIYKTTIYIRAAQWESSKIFQDYFNSSEKNAAIMTPFIEWENTQTSKEFYTSSLIIGGTIAVASLLIFWSPNREFAIKKFQSQASSIAEKIIGIKQDAE